jgi:hypothetical protein
LPLSFPPDNNVSIPQLFPTAYSKILPILLSPHLPLIFLVLPAPVVLWCCITMISFYSRLEAQTKGLHTLDGS